MVYRIRPNYVAVSRVFNSITKMFHLSNVLLLIRYLKHTCIIIRTVLRIYIFLLVVHFNVVFYRLLRYNHEEGVINDYRGLSHLDP